MPVQHMRYLLDLDYRFQRLYVPRLKSIQLLLSTRVLSLHPGTEPKPAFLDDRPIGTSKDDEFNYTLFVDQLENVITNCETPANIGLFGRWGVGKTSILNLLEERIHEKPELEKRFDYVRIDAWKLSKESLRQQLLLELNRHYNAFKREDDLEDILFNIRQVPLQAQTRIWERVISTLRLFPLFFVLSAVILIFAYYARLSPSTTVELLLVPLFLQVAEKVIAAASEVRETATKIVPKIEYPHQFENLFRRIVEKKGRKTLVLAVDNLDRCESDVVVDFLGTIKTFLEVPGCVYLLACDDEALEKHLVTVKGQNFAQADAREFLRKFFHTSLRIPALIDEDLEKYMDRALSKIDVKFDESVKEVLLQAITKNPRRIKQFVNNLVVTYGLAEAKEQKGLIRKRFVTGNTGFLAKIMVIRDEWPDFYRQLEQQDDLLNQAERYFQGDESQQVNGKPIQGYFQENQGIEWFLKATRTITSDDVLPFLRLHQESYESTIPELEVLRLRVRQNDVEYVRRTVEKLTEQERTQYTLEILKLLDSDIRRHRFQFAFNALNVLIETLDIVTSEAHAEVVERLQNYLTTKEIKSNLGGLERSKVFHTIGEMIPPYKGQILLAYVELLVKEKSYDVGLLDLLIEHRQMLVSVPEVVDALNQSLGRFLSLNEAEGLRILQQKLCSNPAATNDLVKDTLVAATVAKMTPEATEVNNSRSQVYLALKHRASMATKAAFVHRLLTMIEQRQVNSIDAPIKFAIDQLNSLSSEDIPLEIVERLYSVLADCASRMSNEMEMIQVLAPVFASFAHLKEQSKRDLAEGRLAQLLSRCSLQCVTMILETGKKHSVRLMDYDAFFKALTGRVKSSLPDINLIQLTIDESSESQRVSVGAALAEMIRTNNPGLYTPALQAFQKNHEKLPIQALDGVCEACLEMTKKSPGQASAFLEPILAATARCSSAPKNSLADQTLEYMKSDDVNLSSLGGRYYCKIQDHLGSEKRRYVLRQLIIRLRNLVDRIDPSRRHLIDIVVQGQDVLDEGDLSDFADVMSAQFSTAKPEDVQLAGLLAIAEVKNLGGRTNDIVSHVLELARSTSNEKVRNSAKEVIRRHSSQLTGKLLDEVEEFLQSGAQSA